MKKQKLVAALVAIAITASAHATLITGFGLGDFTDGGSTPGVFTQSATTATFTGVDIGNNFMGTFAPVDISGTTSALVLTATQTTATANSSFFTLNLYDGSRYQGYTGTWDSFPKGTPTDVILAISNVVSADFNFKTVQGLTINFGGSGAALSVSFDSLSASAIPEPATFAVLFGAAALGLTVVRRRRQAA